MIALDILSDPICPWCYIGKARLDRAAAAAGHVPLARRWRMYRLNPDMPREGMDRRAYLEAKFGGAEGAARVYGEIARTIVAEGLPADLDAIARTPDTTDAHRLLRWAETAGAQDAVADGLFEAYFVAGRDISEPGVLSEIAGAAGLDAEVIARLLEGDADRDALVAEETEARAMGVNGVPCFVLNGRYVLQGAQPAETWLKVIEELNAALASGETPPGQES